MFHLGTRLAPVRDQTATARSRSRPEGCLPARTAMSFAAMLGIAALSALVALGQSDSGLGPLNSDLKNMANKEGMISKKDFMAMMEKRFDMMDKNKKGMIHMTEATKIFSDKP